jgi:ABC-type polysaccharide/polyol phosphate export permease
VVDGAALTDKIWFPRALLVLAPIGANLVGLGIGLGIVTAIQLARGELGPEVLLAVPAAVLLVALATGLSLVTSALYVPYRDVRFVVQAATLLLFYVTPILYTPERLGGLADLLPLNPFAGAVGLFQQAFAGAAVGVPELVGTLLWTTVLLVTGVVLHQRGDRTFVDLL